LTDPQEIPMDRRDFLTHTTLTTALGSAALASHAQARPKDVLIVANEFGPNSLDIHTVGANRPSYGVSWICYDRLLTYGKKKLADGRISYDRDKLEPELAESWAIAPDGNSATFKLRKNAKFHDGTPVTAKDVKWSFDRAVTVGGFPTFQMAAGSLEKPEQFEVVDDHTFRIKFLRRDKLTMNDLAVPVPCIFNSELVKKNATPQDPWGLAYTRNNVAGGGAYKVESWRSGQEIVYIRNDDWKSGALPKLRRIVQRDVPSAGNRRALLLKGDIDITFDLPPKDFSELAGDGAAVKVSSTAIENSMFYLGMNTTKPPFNDVKVRQAVAYALPYDKIYENAAYKRAGKLWGGRTAVTSTAWPQPTGYSTDINKAKALMAEAGLAAGLDTTLSFDLGGATVGEPTAVLIQESLAQIGIRAQLNKIPGATWRAALLKKDMPMIINRFGGWLDYPEYFFFWCYHGQNAVFNTMSYQNAKLDKTITNARFAESKPLYDSAVKEMIQIAYDEVPRVPIMQPTMDVAMQKDVMGYQYWFHLQPDYRQLFKA
jgi:peptide/nickel transport system substrate-binding protein